MTDKKQLRKHFKEIRSGFQPHEKEMLDNGIYVNLTASEEYKCCNDLLIYVSGCIEADTLKIIGKALGEKRVFCPKCVRGTNIMHFYRISGFDSLERGEYGIWEPKNSCERSEKFENAMCVIPALSCDSEGYRLGFGKGFYDRFLTGFSGVKAVLCYDCCTVPALPYEIYDIKADMIITEKRTVRFNQKKG